MPNRQDLIDALLELTRDPIVRTWTLSYLLLHMSTQQLLEAYDAACDYEDVRQGGTIRRARTS